MPTPEKATEAQPSATRIESGFQIKTPRKAPLKVQPFAGRPCIDVFEITTTRKAHTR